MSTAEWVIRTEEDAWALLKEACSKPELSAFNISFDNWPVLDIKLTGKPFDSTLSTKMMEAFIELQKNINRTYAKLYYNYPTSRGLTIDDKQKIELFVQVREGSSWYTVDLQQIFEQFVQGVAGKMTGKQATLIIISVALLLAGNSYLNTYLEYQKEVKGLEMKQLAGEQETSRMKIFAEAVKQEPQITTAKADAEEVYNAILKAAAKADSARISGTTLNGAQAEKLARSTRSRAEEVDLSGEYRVVKIDNSNPDHFEVKVNDGYERLFTARLHESLVLSRNEIKEILDHAIWSREPVRLMIKGTVLRDQVTQATITDVPARHMARR